MSITKEQQLEKIQTLHREASLLQEGDTTFIFLPGFSFHAAGQSVTMDLLLSPSAHTGYPTRLFFQNKIEGRGTNWNQFCIGGRQWWAHSWNNVPESLPWIKILYAHLEALK